MAARKAPVTMTKTTRSKRALRSGVIATITHTIRDTTADITGITTDVTSNNKAGAAAQPALHALFAPPPFLVRRGEMPLSIEAGPWAVYVLTHRRTGRTYVGLTKRTIAQRVSAHVSHARRDTGCRPGGLLEALRTELAAGRFFAAAFEARIVCRCATAADAAIAERQWIVMLGSAAPHGYNLMPGGGVGSVANARQVSVEVGQGRWEVYATIYEAIGHRNRRLRDARQAGLDPYRVYARLAAGWSAAEALGYQTHTDRRGQRAPFMVNGQVYSSLRQAAADTGIPAVALRGRLGRISKVTAPDMPTMQGTPDRLLDISADRRRHATGENVLLGIMWPATGEMLTAAELSARTGVPKSTVLHRWHRVRDEEARRVGRGLPPYSTAEVLRMLRHRTERRKVVRLELPTGDTWQGGERELIRRMQDSPDVDALRMNPLTESGVRRRLRLLSGEQRRSSSAVRTAFGFAAAQAPRRTTSAEHSVVPAIKRERQR